MSIVSAVEQQLKRPPEGYRGLAFVPICGDPPEVHQSPAQSAAVIAARLETAMTGKKDFGHTFSSVASCIPEGFSGERAETLRAFFTDRIEQECNRKLARYQTIKKFAILPNAFSVDGGELTPTLKVKRAVVNEKYADRIAALYA